MSYPASWMQEAGAAIEAINALHFAETLMAGVRNLTPFEFTVIFGYVGASRPIDLFDDFPPARHTLHVSEYQEGPYLLDPFYLAAQDGTKPGIYRLRELAPDRFYQGHYFQSYYAQTGLAEEVGMLIPVNGKCTIVISLMRKTKRFSSAEMRKLNTIWPVVSAVCRQNWAELGVHEEGDETPAQNRLDQAFQTFGEGVLTPREREVVELTLRGHSAESVGALLDISSGTVRIHRRNIYSKLRIGSQGELFHGFLRALLEKRADRAHDRC